jgi:hypothetical protein
MRRRSFDQAQLFTAGSNVGSRGFYERRGWALGGETREWQGFRLVHYTLDLTESAP